SVLIAFGRRLPQAQNLLDCGGDLQVVGFLGIQSPEQFRKLLSPQAADPVQFAQVRRQAGQLGLTKTDLSQWTTGDTDVTPGHSGVEAEAQGLELFGPVTLRKHRALGKELTKGE